MSRLLIPHGASLIPSPYFLLPILLTWTDDRCWRLVFDGGKSEHRRTRWWVTPTGLVARLGTVPQKTDRPATKSRSTGVPDYFLVDPDLVAG